MCADIVLLSFLRTPKLVVLHNSKTHIIIDRPRIGDIVL